MPRPKKPKHEKQETKIFQTRLAQRDVEVLEGLIETYGLESKADALRICIRSMEANLKANNRIYNSDNTNTSLRFFAGDRIEEMLDSQNRLINRYEGDRTVSE